MHGHHRAGEAGANDGDIEKLNFFAHGLPWGEEGCDDSCLV
jgi:hypothetical protein